MGMAGSPQSPAAPPITLASTTDAPQRNQDDLAASLTTESALAAGNCGWAVRVDWDCGLAAGAAGDCGWAGGLANNAIVHTTLDSLASTPMEQKWCEDSKFISTLTFPQDSGPSAHKLATVLIETSESKHLFPGAQKETLEAPGIR
ncbi:hypothetical protein EDD15DRAFT_2195221 [Pisolithus albus]|nr:hypothetical protein EDD15DRAFT_2195221 [Pisolithus albus]